MWVNSWVLTTKDVLETLLLVTPLGEYYKWVCLIWGGSVWLQQNDVLENNLRVNLDTTKWSAWKHFRVHFEDSTKGVCSKTLLCWAILMVSQNGVLGNILLVLSRPSSCTASSLAHNLFELLLTQLASRRVVKCSIACCAPPHRFRRWGHFLCERYVCILRGLLHESVRLWFCLLNSVSSFVYLVHHRFLNSALSLKLSCLLCVLHAKVVLRSPSTCAASPAFVCQVASSHWERVVPP